MKKAELSLLFLTAAGVVCRLGGDHEWYGVCVLTLAILASAELRGQAKAEYVLLHLREKRETDQEEYHLEAYDCNEPEDIEVHAILQQCPEMKELASPSTRSGTKRHNYRKPHILSIRLPCVQSTDLGSITIVCGNQTFE